MSKAFGDDNYQPDSVKAPVKDDGTIKIGDQANPTICKLVVDPRRPQEAFRKTVYHRYMIGPDPRKDGRFMVSRKMFQDKDPINDAFWDAHNKLKELAKAGKDVGDNSTDPEVRKYKGIKKTFANHDRFHLLMVPLNATKPKVCTTVGAVVDLLFGKEAWGTKPAIKGLVYSMKDLKRNPFNLKIETGWLKIWKTGEGIDTRYFAEEYMVDAEMTDPDTNETVTVKRPFKAKVNPAIFELEIDDVPDLSQQDLDKDQMVWTAEECEAFVATFGKAIPERCKKKDRNTVAQESDERDPNYNPNTAKAPWEEEQTADEGEAAAAPAPAPVAAAPKAAAAPKPAAVKTAPKAAPAAAADLDSVF